MNLFGRLFGKKSAETTTRVPAAYVPQRIEEIEDNEPTFAPVELSGRQMTLGELLEEQVKEQQARQKEISFELTPECTIRLYFGIKKSGQEYINISVNNYPFDLSKQSYARLWLTDSGMMLTPTTRKRSAYCYKLNSTNKKHGTQHTIQSSDADIVSFVKRLVGAEKGSAKVYSADVVEGDFEALIINSGTEIKKNDSQH